MEFKGALSEPQKASQSPFSTGKKKESAVGTAGALGVSTSANPPDEPQGKVASSGQSPAAAQSAASLFAHFADGVAPVQRRGPGREQQDALIHRAAAKGIQGEGTQLPFAEQIQRSFGRHDVSAIQAHIGGPATEAAEQMGAAAYATGNRAAFAQNPDLYTAAHEAAHIVQQRGGVKLKGGVGSSGDIYEQHADAVADRVVQGKSAEDLLDMVHGPKSVSPSCATNTGGAVQQRKAQDGKKGASGKAMSRLGKARKAIAHTKKVINQGAGNQEVALTSSNFNSNYRLKVMRDDRGIYWQIDETVKDLVSANPEALTAAKADLAHGGNCGEHADVAFDYLRVAARGETINNSATEGLDHAFVLMGDLGSESDSDLVVADPWPTAATATLWEDHFAFTADRARITSSSTMVADGQNVKKVIARGLRLTEAGKQELKKSESAAQTQQHIDNSRASSHNWVWTQENSAADGHDFEYTKAKEK